MSTRQTSEYFSKHYNLNAIFHILIGLGVGWLSSLGWSWKFHSLISGCIFVIIGIIGHIYPLFIQQTSK